MIEELALTLATPFVGVGVGTGVGVAFGVGVGVGFGVVVAEFQTPLVAEAVDELIVAISAPMSLPSVAAPL